MTYTAPIKEMKFLADQVLGAGRLAETDLFAETTDDMFDAILVEAARLAEQEVAPTNREGDLNPARLVDGETVTAPDFKPTYQALIEGGWAGMTADPEHGGMGLPSALSSCVNEMLFSANLSLWMKVMLSQGAIEAIEHHGDDALKAMCLPNLNAGTWSGTMNLTEPQAGTDVGSVRTKAEIAEDGSYRITGQKIFITWGDSDLTENICHLVLARLPDGGPGTRGLSLFMVPKFLTEGNADAGAANAVRTVSLEHKLGLHGTPTAVGAYVGSKGWIIGKENEGMRAMFTMMNNARLGVGIQGLSQAEIAYQAALAYALERKQGATNVPNGTGTIFDHPDVRRMLVTMKCLTTTARAICLDTALSIDMARATGSPEWAARAAFLTPIAKAFSTDTGCEVAEMGIQVHGGMGYIEETGVAQFYRDAKVLTIYEGTNGIQAIDLVGRKLADGGAAARALLAEVAETVDTATADHPQMAKDLRRSHDVLKKTLEELLQRDRKDRLPGATAFLRAFAMVLGGHYFVKAAQSDDHQNWGTIASYHTGNLLCDVPSLCERALSDTDHLLAVSSDTLAPV